MGLFDRFFAKKAAVPPPDPTDVDDDIRPTPPQPIEGPPEFVRAVELQRTYWTHNAEAQAYLEARGIDQLSWPERLRLHHLNCSQRVTPGADRSGAKEKCVRTLRRLIEADSPYRPRPAMIWQGRSAQPEAEREPDMQGEFLNPSHTHLGCLEVYRVDAEKQPTRLDFVSFDDLSSVIFAPPSLLRAAKLFYDDGRGEVVLVPLLYGFTWFIGDEYCRDGRMTRFIAHIHDEEIYKLGASGIGLGQQDFSLSGQDGKSSLFGIGSVTQIAFPLDMRDPHFDEKARVRGINPEEVRRQMGE